MPRTTLSGKQIKDESIESVDIASGSIKASELNHEAISGHTAITSTDTNNDYLLIWDASDSTLKKVSPANLGISGGSGSSSNSSPLSTNASYSLAANLSGSTGATMGSYTQFTAGIKFMMLRPRSITGARMWNNLTTDTSFKISLWDQGGNRLTSVSQAISAGEDMHSISFSSPYAISESQVGKELYITFYHETGTAYPKTTSNTYVPAAPFIADPHYLILGYNRYGMGDSFPGSTASEYYMIEPVFSAE